MAKIKLNLLDFLIISFTVLFLSLVFMVWYLPTRSLAGQAVLSIKVTEDYEAIEKAAELDRSVFLNGSNRLATVESVKIQDDYLVVRIKGPAEKNKEVLNFNGQRVLLGQRVELHGSFFARGTITNFEYDK